MKTLSLATMMTAVLVLPAFAQESKPTIDRQNSGPTQTMSDETPKMTGDKANEAAQGANANPAADSMERATPTMTPNDPASGRADAATSPGSTATTGAPVRLTAAEAEKWVNKAVYSSDNKNLGEVSAFVRGADDTVSEMHVDIGGFLGLGETRVRLMPAQFKMQNDRVILDLTADQAKNLPPIKK